MKKILSEFCDDPVYYEDEWWLNATCGSVEVSLLLGIGSATDIIVRSLSGSLDPKIVQKLIGAALDGVKYIYYSPDPIHIEFIDGDSIRVETIGGDKGLLSLAPADVEKITGLYSGIITMRRVLFAIGWTLFAVVLMFLDDIIQLSKTLSVITTMISIFMLLETFVILFVVFPRPAPGIVRRLGGTDIIIGRENVRIMKMRKGIVVDASMIEDSNKLLFVISDETLPSYA